MGAPDPTQFTSADADTIKIKARRFARRHDMPDCCVEDVSQELSLHVWMRLSRFDASRGTKREAFVEVIAANRAANIADRERAQKRDRRRDINLDDAPLLESVDKVNEIDLRADVRTAIDGLPPPLQDLALRLQRQTVAEIERETGLTRGQIRHRIQALRRHFEKLEITPFLNNQLARGSGS